MPLLRHVCVFPGFCFSNQAAFAESIFYLTFPIGTTHSKEMQYITNSKWSQPKRDVPSEVTPAYWENAIARPLWLWESGINSECGLASSIILYPLLVWWLLRRPSNLSPACGGFSGGRVVAHYQMRLLCRCSLRFTDTCEYDKALNMWRCVVVFFQGDSNQH